MRRPTFFFVYLLGAYVILQFIWWGYHLIELTKESGQANTDVKRRVFMIFGEGSVFLLLLIFGLYKIRSSILKEREFAKRQRNFMLSVTHELKTPLASVRLFVQTLLRRELSEEKSRDLLEKSLEENQRLELLVENILTSAQLEQNSFIPNLEDIELASFLETISRDFKVKYNRKVDLMVSTIKVKTDPLMFRMIIDNLLENAAKYSDDGASITIELLDELPQLKIRISDIGIGIPVEEQSKIFEAFYRVGNEETRKSKGTGLGLYLSKKIAQALNGNVRLDTSYKKGACFEINLPYGY